MKVIIRIASPSFILICLLISLLLYYCGSVPRNEWNENALKTQCQIEEHAIGEHQCSYSCNCHQTCSNNNKHCTTHCSTCYYDCYNGYILGNYTVNGIDYEFDFEVVSNKKNSHDVTRQLNQKYPIGSTVNCYYQFDNPSDSRLHLKESLSYYIGSLVVGSLGGLVLIIWMILEIKWLRLSPTALYQSLKEKWAHNVTKKSCETPN